MRSTWAVIAVIVAVAAIASALLVYDNIGVQDNDNIADSNTSAPPIPVTEPAIPKDIVTGNNDFAIDFYRQVSGSDDANIFFSPTSMYMAFSILYEGARENTAQQIQQVFGFESDDTLRYDAVTHTMSSLNQDDPHAILEMGNSLWLAHHFDAYDSYVNVVRDTYTADVERVSFTDESDDGAVSRINNWASEKTHGKITKVLTQESVNALTVAAILNAVYFKGTWVTQFPEEDTRESEFWKTSTTSITADFMNVMGMFNYTQRDGIQVLQMPYKGDRLSMLVILPSDRNGIGHLQEIISTDLIEEWQRDMTETEVIVSIPKFEARTNYDLKPLLLNLGIIDVFGEEISDLSGIADTSIGNLYVTKALHDAYVKINEEGTEAAAVTTIVIARESAGPSPPIFVADHPFIFIIQDDESDAILFMGQISNPTS